jgi:hypothetical protein
MQGQLDSNQFPLCPPPVNQCYVVCQPTSTGIVYHHHHHHQFHPPFGSVFYFLFVRVVVEPFPLVVSSNLFVQYKPHRLNADFSLSLSHASQLGNKNVGFQPSRMRTQPI